MKNAYSNLDPRFLQRKSQTKVYHGHNWFFRLNPPSDYDDPKFLMKNKQGDTGLFGFYGQAIKNSQGIILCRDVMRKVRVGLFDKMVDPKAPVRTIQPPKAYKQFAYFETLEDAVEHINKWPLDQRHFYELIGATSRRQKPYFDLDINMESIVEYTQRHSRFKDWTQSQIITGAKLIATEMLAEILHVIVCKFLCTFDGEAHKSPTITLKRSDICIYETAYSYQNQAVVPSEDLDASLLKRKYSYHVVIQSFYFSTSEAMRAFGQAVREEYNQLCHRQWQQVNQNVASDPDFAHYRSNYAYIIDDIWHATRQLRLMGSSKAESPTSKKFWSRLEKGSPMIQMFYDCEPVDLWEDNPMFGRFFSTNRLDVTVEQEMLLSFVCNVENCVPLP